MRLPIPTPVRLLAPLFLLASCVESTPTDFGPQTPSTPTIPNTGTGSGAASVNFASAWVYLFDDAERATPHGDVHRLSDGSFAVLRMPGGRSMEVVRFSPEGIPLGSSRFDVPADYAGCPFMPNEETFVDDAAILSYGSSVFRVDLAAGKLAWEARLSGQLEHSTAGFWVVEDLNASEGARIRPLDIETGALLPGLAVADLGGGANRQFYGARVVYHGEEDRERAYRSDAADAATRAYLVAHVEHDGTAPTARLTIDSYGEGAITPTWTYNHDFAMAGYGRANYAVAGGRLLVAAADELLAIDLATGTEAWRHAVRKAPGGFDGVYAFSNVPLQVNATGTEVRFYDLNRGYHRVSLATGKAIGERVQGDARTVAAEPIGDDYALLTCPDGEVLLQDARTGAKVRSFRAVKSFYHGPVGTHYDAEADRLVLAGGSGIYGIDDPVGNVIE